MTGGLHASWVYLNVIARKNNHNMEGGGIVTENHHVQRVFYVYARFTTLLMYPSNKNTEPSLPQTLPIFDTKLTHKFLGAKKFRNVTLWLMKMLLSWIFMPIPHSTLNPTNVVFTTWELLLTKTLEGNFSSCFCTLVKQEWNFASQVSLRTDCPCQMLKGKGEGSVWCMPYLSNPDGLVGCLTL